MTSITCAICMESMKEDNVLLYLKCGHVYHNDCLEKWLNTARTCPECRVRVNKIPTRLYLQFNDNPDDNELIEQLSKKTADLEIAKIQTDLMRNEVSKLESDHKIKDRILKSTVGYFKQLVARNNGLKCSLTDLEKKNDESEKIIKEINELLSEQKKQNVMLTENVRLLRNQMTLSNDELRQKSTEVESITEKLTKLNQINKDCLKENDLLEFEKIELSNRLDQFRNEFVTSNKELQFKVHEVKELRNGMEDLKRINQNTLNQLNLAHNHTAQLKEVVLHLTEKGNTLKYKNSKLKSDCIELESKLNSANSIMLNVKLIEIKKQLDGTGTISKTENDIKKRSISYHLKADESKRQKLNENSEIKSSDLKITLKRFDDKWLCIT